MAYSLLDAIYGRIVPTFAGLSLAVALLIVSRSTGRRLGHRISKRWPQFGRKGLLISGAAMTFAFSCFYRALNIADEGAYLCRGPPTIFNAPAAGRFVATIGELALVVQLTVYLDDTSRRLGVTKPGFSSNYYSTMIPALIGETCSWLGVLLSTSAFFCLEYIMWIIIGGIWAWDGAECLHRSIRRGDIITHATIVIGGLSLILFNLLHELPHFWVAKPLAPERPNGGSLSRVWVCTADHDSHIWTERIGFFVSYFICASWAATSLAGRYFMRGGFKRGYSGDQIPATPY
jgi:hypothetical protein